MGTGRAGVSCCLFSVSDKTPQDALPDQVAAGRTNVHAWQRSGQMSEPRKAPDKCPGPRTNVRTRRGPGQMSASAGGPDKCPSRKSRRTNVQAPSGRGQMSKPWTAAGKCRSPSPFAGRRNRPRQMPKPFGKCRAAESPTANGEARTDLWNGRAALSSCLSACSGQRPPNILP
jgi:hypothetical protein